MINNIVICNVSCLKRSFGIWVCSHLQMIAVILQVVIIIIIITITIIIALSSHQFSWFSKSRVLLTKHVLSITAMLRLLNVLLSWFCQT